MGTTTSDGGPQGLLLWITVGASALALGLTALATSLSTIAPTWGWSWLLLLGLSLAVQHLPLTLRAEGERLQYVFSELPLVFGLFLFSPLQVLVARVGAQLLHELVVRRLTPAKVTVNAASYGLEAAIASAVFWLLVPAGEPIDAVMHTPTMLVTLLAVLSGTVLGGTVVWTALASSRAGSFDVRGYVGRLRLIAPIAVVNASVALIAVVVIHEAPGASWILVIPALVLAVGYRRYLQERSERRVLGMLYGLAGETHASHDLEGALAAVARTVREHVEAGLLELYVRRAGGGAWRLRSDVHGESSLAPVQSLPRGIDDSLAEDEPVRELDDHGRVTAVTYSMDLGNGRAVALVARDPVSEIDGFHEHAIAALEAVAAQARVAIDDAELQEAKDSFLSSVSHELRTPLAVVLGAAETLQIHRDRLAPEVVNLLTERLHGQARRLDGLLRDLLDVDRLGRGMLEPTFAWTDLGALLHRCVLSLAIESHVVVVRASAIEARVDASACERIVENLVMNAVKYSPPGTTVTVEATATEDEVTFTVTDEGPGIADRDKRRVFQPFTRLDEGHAAPGTGIGLSLVQRLVHMHEGTVAVRDSASGGSCFAVTLPRWGSADPADPAAVAPDVVEHQEA